MNALCPPNPAVGQQPVTVQVFTVSGTYMPSPGLVSLIVECIGPGGGGGDASATAATVILTGGGGGSGGYSKKFLPASLVAGGVIVTVPAGPAGGTGVQGGPTSFGALCVANGGYGGRTNDGQINFGDGGPGGPVGVGDVTYAGASGFTGITDLSGTVQTAQGGMGGAIFGGTQINLVGLNVYAGGLPGADGTGAGGSGAAINTYTNFGSIGYVAGGLGGKGICIVTEYCAVGAGAGGGSGCVNVPACPPGQWGYDG